MEASLGRPVCGGELYAAHFLGADSACKLIRTSQSAPDTSAAQLFPQAAAANRNVFFHADGSAKNVREVYDWALQQPGAAAPLAPAATATENNGVVAARTTAAHAVDANIEALLAGGMNWRPSSFFGSDKPLSLGSGLLDLLSSVRNGL